MPLDPQIVGRLKVRALHSFFTRNVLLPTKERLSVRETAGLPLIAGAACAMIWANWPGSESYERFWESGIVLHLGFFSIEESLRHLVNSALLPLLFFVIGMEVKYEVMAGDLSSRRRAMMPLMMGLGGVLVPVAVYLGIQQGIGGGQHMMGWGVPIATDIVFAVAIFKLLGDRLPGGMRSLKMAFATVDNMAAVLVIAFVYTSATEFSLTALVTALALYLLLWILRLLDVHAATVYAMVGLVFLAAFYLSAVHTTVAGMLLGLLATVKPRMPMNSFIEQLDRKSAELNELHRRRLELERRNEAEVEECARIRDLEDDRLGQIEALLQEGQPDNHRWHSTINPWLSYIVLPVFALANAGVRIRGETLSALTSETVPWAIAAGLLLGKPLGIAGFAFLAEKTGLAKMPEQLNWHHIIGLGILGAIGFTVALFINELAFGGARAGEVSKLGILLASVPAGFAGYFYLRWACRGDSAYEKA